MVRKSSLLHTIILRGLIKKKGVFYFGLIAAWSPYDYEIYSVYIYKITSFFPHGESGLFGHRDSNLLKPSKERKSEKCHLARFTPFLNAPVEKNEVLLFLQFNLLYDLMKAGNIQGDKISNIRIFMNFSRHR